MYYLWHCGPDDLNILKHTCTGARCEFCIMRSKNLGCWEFLKTVIHWVQLCSFRHTLWRGTDQLTDRGPLLSIIYPANYLLSWCWPCLQFPTFDTEYETMQTQIDNQEVHVSVPLPCLASTTKCCSCMLFSELLAWTVCIYNDIYEVTKLPIRDLQ